MTLGHVYDLDLKKNEQLIKEVIIQAQGEVSAASLKLMVCSCASLDGPGRVHQTSKRGLDKLHARSCQLSKQMSINTVGLLIRLFLCSLLMHVLVAGMIFSTNAAKT